jgi:hypothetical protein
MASGPLLIDIQQLIPLPEAASFQTQIGVKRQAERQGRSERHILRYKYWEGLLALAKTKTPVHANRNPTKDNWISGGIGRTGFSLNYVVREHDNQVELWIGHGAGQKEKNKRAFEALLQQKTAIESDFGDDLNWEELPERDGSRVSFRLPGGFRSSQDEWPTIQGAQVDAMVRLEKAMRDRVHQLRF